MRVDIPGIKALRQRTAGGIMDCQRALVDAGGDVEAAARALNARGPASSKANRRSPEGLIACRVEGRQGVLIELAAETDFVCRNHRFQDAAALLAQIALSCGGERGLTLSSRSPDGDGEASDFIERLALDFGENIFLRQTAALESHRGVLGAYIHNSPLPGFGRQAAIVAVSGGAVEALGGFAPKLAMHVVGASPLWTEVDQVPLSIREQKHRLTERPETSEGDADRPEVEIAARLDRFYQLTVLTRQRYLPDPTCTVAEKLANVVGDAARVESFVRLRVGEDASHDARVAQAAELEWTFGNDWSKEAPVDLTSAHDVLVFHVAPRGPKLLDDRDAVDLINAAWSCGSNFIAFPVSRLPLDFFPLSTRKAGTILQKFSNLGTRVAIVGDLSEQVARGTALRDFIYESNNRDQVWFVPDMNVPMQRLAVR